MAASSRGCLAFCVLCTALRGTQAQPILQDTVLDISSSTSSLSVLGNAATFSSALNRMSVTLLLPPYDTFGSMSSIPLFFGCSPLPRVPSSGSYAYVLSRGNCTFLSKATACASSGAAACIIYDSPQAHVYASSSNISAADASPDRSFSADSPCAFDCSAGSASLPISLINHVSAYEGFTGMCEGGGVGCASHRCMLTSTPPDVTGSRRLCCATSDPMIPGAVGGASDVGVPVVYVSLADGVVLQSMLTTAGAVGAPGPAPLTASVYPRQKASFQLSFALLWALGCAAVTLAAWKSAEADRAAASMNVASDGAAAPATAAHSSDTSPITISWMQAVGFVVMAACVLLTLYGLVRAGVPIVYIIIPVFFLGSWGAVRGIVVEPLLHKYIPQMDSVHVATLPTALGGARVTASLLVALSVSAVLPIVWITTRLQSWSWLTQDTLGVLMCCMFLTQLRLGSLRSAATLFIVFFIYDIFMVFITPYIAGTSVMIDVATAGQPAASADYACQCRQNPGKCGPTEFMPILLRLPRMDDYQGGYVMLGLGDIVVPGLLLSFALRSDILLRRAKDGARDEDTAQPSPLPRWQVTYFLVACIGYYIGLACAYAAVLLMAMGQPALLYLCPLTMAPVLALAWYKSEVHVLWKGAYMQQQTPADDTAHHVTAALEESGATATHLLDSGEQQEQAAGPGVEDRQRLLKMPQGSSVAAGALIVPQPDSAAGLRLN